MTTSAAQEFKNAIFEEHTGETAEALAKQAQRVIANSLSAAATITAKLSAECRGGIDQVPAEKQFFSCGKLASILRVPPSMVRAVAKAAGVKPVFAIDDQVYFSGVEFIAIADAFRASKSK